MRSLVIYVLFALMAVWSFDGRAQDIRRVALVIGIGDYAVPEQSLPNPANDARDIAASLRTLGYDVIEALDISRDDFVQQLQAFAAALEGADTAVFFYAGHGMEYAGRNYLFPSDSRLDRETDVRLKLIDVDDVLWTMETAVPTRLMFLDACRDNPLALALKQSLPADRAVKVQPGMTEIDTQIGTFMAFATAPGEVAFDGEGKNSPFTAALLDQLQVPEQDVDTLMRGVRNQVIEATASRQVPYSVSSLRRAVALNTGGKVFPVSAPGGNEPLFDPARIAMAGRIVINCNKTGNTPHFGIGESPVLGETSELALPGGKAFSASVEEGEEVVQLLRVRDEAFEMVLVQGEAVACSYSDRLTTDGRGGQWRAWRFLADNGGERIGRERAQWSGEQGAFRLVSDVVRLSDNTQSPRCRSFVGMSDISKRVFAGFACGSSLPQIDGLEPAFNLLQWP